MSFIELVKNRRSIRKYKPNAVPDKVINELLEAARLAPSGCNAQPWKYVVIKDRNTINELVEQHIYHQNFVRHVPLLIVGCADATAYEANKSGIEAQINDGTQPEGVDEYMRKVFRGQELTRAERDLAVSMTYMHLQAVAIGLGTCPVGRGSFDRERLHSFLDLPLDIEPLLSLAVGYAAESPQPRPRKPLKEIIYRTI